MIQHPSASFAFTATFLAPAFGFLTTFFLLPFVFFMPAVYHHSRHK